MKQKIIETWRKTDDIILRYPMVLVMALIAAISAVAAIEMENRPDNFLLVKLIITSCLGISLMFAIKMLSQRIGNGFLMEVIGTLLLIGLYFYLPSSEREFGEVYAYLLIPLFILSHLLVSFAPHFYRAHEIKFWQYNKNLFINIFLTAVFTGVLVLGVVLAILAVDKLFDLQFDEILYPKTFAFLGIFGSCFIFLLFCNRGLPEMENTTDYPQILKFFTQFILIPLLIIYLVILYFYSAKILLNWELPRGWVSYLVLAYSVVGIFALLLVHPLKEEASKSWVKLFSKIFYYSLIPLLVLLFVAINTRILEYGYTEPRYYVLLLALWLLAVVVYFIAMKQPVIKFIPFSLFVFGICSLIFPYFNAFSVAERSQKAELAKILHSNNLLVDGKINFTKPVSAELADEISNKFNFLNERKEREFLFQYLNSTQQNSITESNPDNYGQITTLVHSYFKNVRHENIPKNMQLTAKNSFADVRNYEYAADFQDILFQPVQLNGDSFQLKALQHKKEYVFTVNENAQYDLLPYLQQTARKYATSSGINHVPEMTHEFDIDQYHVKIIFKSISADLGEKSQYFFENGMVLIRKR